MVNCLVKSAKTKYYCGLFQDAKGNAKKVWNAVNKVCYRISSSESVQCIISDGIQHTTPKSIASAMNSFFASIGKRLADKITTTWPSCNSSTDFLKSQFQLAELEESFVPQQLLALKTNKAIGLDKISARLLKNSAHTIALSVTKLLNLSIKTGKFPKLWKCSKITALFKSGDWTNASNYRPISILPIHSSTSSWLFFTVSNATKMPHRRAVLKVGQNESIIQLYLGSGTNKVILVNIIVLLEKIEGCTE